MIRLFNKIGNILHYWESWENEDGKSATVHWGVVGEYGETKLVKAGIFSNPQKEIQKEISTLDGYSEIPLEEYHILIIEYAIDGMGTDAELQKRHALEDKLQEILGWTGLGYCDGGSIGSGSMEVCCLIVDYEIAKKVIEAHLAQTEFMNYSNIYCE